jgi:hypothetical protein
MLRTDHRRNGEPVRRFRFARRARPRGSRRAVSDIIATILLLGLTVVLFGTVLAFVIGFPNPIAAPASQFSSQLITEANGTGIAVQSIQIAHAGGSIVPVGALVYLKSSLHPKGPEFANPYPLTAGGIPAGHAWSPGVTFVLNSNFTGGFHPVLPDNITIYIIAGTNLVYSAVLPGTAAALPPIFSNPATSPASPAIGESFNISVQISGVYSYNKVFINLSGLPGTFPALHPMVYIGGVWNYTVQAGWTTSSGQYYAVVNATTNANVLARTAVSVSITPYSTLITHSIALGVSSSAALCTGAGAPVAACQASGDYYYLVPILYSPITFGNVLFEVLTPSGSTYTATTHAAFAVAKNSAPTAFSAEYIFGSPYSMLMPNSGWSALGGTTTELSPLTSAYQISIDMGTVNPAGVGNTFIVIGIGPYSGQTVPVALP